MPLTTLLKPFLAFAPALTAGDRPEIKQDTDEVVASTVPTAFLNISDTPVVEGNYVIWSQCSSFKKKKPPATPETVSFLRDTLSDSTYYMIQQFTGDDKTKWENPDPKLCNAKLLEVVGGSTSFTPAGTDIALHQKYFVSHEASRTNFETQSVAFMRSDTRRLANSFTSEGGVNYWFKSGVVMKGFDTSKSKSYFHIFQHLSDNLPEARRETGASDAYEQWEKTRSDFDGSDKAWLKLASTVDHTSSPMYPAGQPSVPESLDALDNWKWVTCASDLRSEGAVGVGFNFKMRSGLGGDGNFQTLHAGTSLSFPGCRSQSLDKASLIFKGVISDNVKHNVVLHMEYEVLPSSNFLTATQTFIEDIVGEKNVVFALVALGATWNQKNFYHMILVFSSYNTYVDHSENSLAFSNWAVAREQDRTKGNGWLKQSTSVNLAGSPLYNAQR